MRHNCDPVELFFLHRVAYHTAMAETKDKTSGASATRRRRWKPTGKEAPSLCFEETLERMATAVAKCNLDKVRIDDLARSGGAPEEAE
jgi:hypothetical protein